MSYLSGASSSSSSIARMPAMPLPTSASRGRRVVGASSAVVGASSARDSSSRAKLAPTVTIRSERIVQREPELVGVGEELVRLVSRVLEREREPLRARDELKIDLVAVVRGTQVGAELVQHGGRREAAEGSDGARLVSELQVAVLDAVRGRREKLVGPALESVQRRKRR